MKIDSWKGAYPSNWRGLIVPEAITHPAKYSSKLIRKIYDHIAEEGWVNEGDRVVDMFGGVGLGALDAMRLGLSWRGIELESRFSDLGNANIDLWNSRFSSMPHWNRDAKLINGDSRKLVELLAEAGAVVSSPPYADSIQTSERGSGFDYTKSKSGGKHKTAGREATAKGYGVTEGNLGTLHVGDFSAAISSPPFRQSSGGTNVPKGMDEALMKRHAAGNGNSEAYGATEGQLANMGEGDFDQVISSPPFVNGTEGVMRASKFKDPEAFARTQMTKGHGASFEAKMRAMKKDDERAAYGETEGNIGNLPAGNFDQAISSPPYESSAPPQDKRDYSGLREHVEKKHGRTMKRSAELMGAGDYGHTEGQIGETSGDDFWSAARIIVEQTYLILRPGGHACFVVKDFVKGGKIVPFCDQWRQLCEAVGFETLHEHHAELVRHNGTSHTLEGGEHKHIKSSKSFFRRVAESHGSPEINYECVFCMVKR